MCTAITYKNYFGRTLDLDRSYNETVTVTPQNYPLTFRKAPTLNHHYALIGIAYVPDNYPLYYDAINEHGLGMAGLNFPGNTVYYQEKSDMDNITPFEFIPWILGQCKNVSEAKALLARINLLDLSYSDKLPLSPLHWIIADKNQSVIVETMAGGMKIYDNPVGVFTNNPPFDFMINYLTAFRDLSCEKSVNRLTSQAELPAYSHGFGAFGLPGDYSSPSRFVKAAFTKLNSVSDDCEEKNVSQFFHILSSVEVPRGCVKLSDNAYHSTVYTACGNLDTGVYYYTTYNNHQLTAVNMHSENLDGKDIKSYPLREKQNIYWEN